MTSSKPAWKTSPAMGMALAQLIDLYARALRVDIELKKRRMERLVNLLERRNDQ